MHKLRSTPYDLRDTHITLIVPLISESIVHNLKQGI